MFAQHSICDKQFSSVGHFRADDQDLTFTKAQWNSRTHFSKEMLSTEGKVVILQHFRWLSSGSPIALSSVIHSAANLNMGLQGHKV